LKKLLKLLGAFFISIILLCFGLFIFLYINSPGTMKPLVNKNGLVIKNSISEMRFIKLGNMKQFITIRGKNQSNPILLLLHGGPGTTQTHLFNTHNIKLENHYTLVNWEQRGAGKSYNKNIDSKTMTEKQFIQDTHELTMYLKQRFNKKKIFILGHSWGSHIGLLTAAKFPNDYHGYIAIGQSIDIKQSEDISYQNILKKAKEDNNHEAIDELLKFGPPRNGKYKGGIKNLIRLRKWWRHYGGSSYNPDDLFSIFIKPLIFYRGYTIKDKLSYFSGEIFSVKHLLSDMTKANMAKRIPELKIPVYFLHGIHDQQTVYSLVEKYYHTLRAPHKKLYTFKNSAHFLPYEEIDRFHNIMINEIKK